MTWLHISMSRLRLFQISHSFETTRACKERWRKLLLESQVMLHNWKCTDCSLYVIVLKEMNPAECYFSQTKSPIQCWLTSPKWMYSLHCDILKSHNVDCRWIEWNLPWKTPEVPDGEETREGCLRVRGFQQLRCVFKHFGQYKRSFSPRHGAHLAFQQKQSLSRPVGFHTGLIIIIHF